MAGWHHWLDGRESQWTPGVGDGQGGLACCDSWGRRVRHDRATELNWWSLLKFLLLWSQFYRCVVEPGTVVFFFFPGLLRYNWQNSPPSVFSLIKCSSCMQLYRHSQDMEHYHKTRKFPYVFWSPDAYTFNQMALMHMYVFWCLQLWGTKALKVKVKSLQSCLTLCPPHGP